MGFYLFVKFGLSWFFEHDHNIGFKKYALTSEILASSLTIFMIAKTINTLTRVFIWDYIVARILKGLVPILLIQCVALSVYVLAFLIIVGMVFGKSVVGVLTTLGGIGVIIGLGTQRLVLDAFSGISINVDRSFTLGDFIEVSTQDYTLKGKVIKISWRLTTLLTPENALVSIPNSVISGVPVTNFSKPDPISEFQETYFFSASSNPSFIEKILSDAALAVAEIGFIEKDPAPRVFLAKVMPSGKIGVSITYFANPLKNSQTEVKHFLHSIVLKHTKAAELHAMDLSQPSSHRVPAEFIENIALFDCLKQKERQFLLKNMVEHAFTPNMEIVTQGGKGTSMFIIKQGFVTVHVKHKNGQTSMVSVLNPGDFFGEMSLLTGQKRNATVVSGSDVMTFEIQKEVLQKLLSDNEKLYAEFAKASAHKVLATKEHFNKLANMQTEHKNLFDEYLLKIKNFFR